MSLDSLKVLVVEDDPKVAHSVSSNFVRHGFDAFRCATAAEAIDRFDREAVDVAVLDLGLPDRDGLEVLRHIRRQCPQIPVLILTARDGVADRVRGLEEGADDYLVKPFALAELLARVRALARRVELGRQATVRFEDLEISLSDRAAIRSGEPLRLSPREFDLLKYLLDHQGQVVTRSMLARDVWKYDSRATPIDNVIDVQMSRLREKVDKPHDRALIRTVRGVGFILGGCD